MKNFKRILAIVLVVMMVVPMMTTGLSAATALMSAVQTNTGAEIADGNWKAFVYNDWSTHYGPDLAAFDNLGTADVSAEGQIVLYNQIQTTYNNGFGGYGFTCGNIRNALQSTNTTEINGLYFRNGMMPTQGAKVVYGETMSYAFSETQLQGALDTTTYTLDDGFGVAGGMVSDGLVVTLVGGNASANQTDLYSALTAYVLDGGAVVSFQSFELSADAPVYVGVSANNYFSIVDGVLTLTVEDVYGIKGAVAFVFDELDISGLKTDKSYYFAIGTGAQGDPSGATVDADGSVNINIARISDFVIAEDGTYTVTDSENKNVADWTGNGVATCEHVWGEYVELTAPSCTATGLSEAACQNGCGATDTKTIDALGHSWSDWANTVAPTCTEAGTRARSCTTCGEEQTDVAAATGHDWSEWYTTVEPDCTTAGMEQRDCGVCGSYEENVLPALGHTWVWDTLPTYTVNGARHCEACDAAETDLAYDVSYYWTIASNNKIGTIDEGYADYNDEYNAVVDGSIELQDLSLVYGGDYNYNTMLKATSEFATEISGFSATVENVTAGYEGTALEGQYPTVLSFMWTTEKENYDGANEFSTYVPASSVGCYGTAESSRYGHLWNNYIAGKEYSVNVVLSDGCHFWGSTWYGELDDGEYDWIYYAVISGGNFWNLKMIQPSPVINALEPITVSIFQEMDFTANKLGLYCDVNGFLFDFGDLAGSQTVDKNYYFSVAAYGDGANAATASFKITDVCGQSPDLFTGYEHECYDLDPDTAEIAASCFTDGAHLCAVCQEVLEVIPAAGKHTWTDATCTVAKTCSVCGATEGEPAGHTYVDFYCSVCGEAEGAAYIGTTVYADLQSALTAAVSMDKVVLLKNCVNDAAPFTVGVQQNIDIDLNGFTLRNKSGDALVIDSANVYIYGTNGGTIRSSDGIAIVVKNGGNANIFDAITVRCSSEEGFNVFSLDETSTAKIYALGGRYYKDPTACGVALDDGLSISGEGTNWTVIETPVECTHDWGEWVVTVEPTETTEGSQTRTCTLCGDEETEAIPATGVVEPEVKDYVITFDPAGGTMPEGALLELPINYNDNYKEAAGYEYPVPTLEVGYVFTGWYWADYNYTLYKGDWDTGYYAVQQSITLEALYEECAHTNMGEWTTTTEPSYDAEGEQTRTCADCGYVETQAIDKLLRDWVITFDPAGGTMPEGVPTELRINTNDNYKTVAGYEYPVPTLEVGYVFTGWYWADYNYTLYKGDWDTGYYAVAQDITLEALYEECAHTNMGEWTVTVEPQVGVEGEQTRTCPDCGTVETETIPALEPAKDYVITFDPAGGVMPEGALTELPINYQDNYKEAAGYEYPVPTLDGYVFTGWYWADYNYTLYKGDWDTGYYAVQQSITLEALYEEAPEVAVVTEGNVITVTNVDSSVKDIFVAAGTQETYKDVKANMLYHLYATSHKVVDGAWTYNVSENGAYTVLVRYNDGTVEAKYFYVDCNDGTVADCVQDGATVTFNNLNDLYVLRYVAGEYDSSYAIKRAPGVVNVSPKYNADQFVNNSFSVTLEPGVYSFVTQFNDGNYVYYTITVEAPQKDYKITFDPDGGVMPEGVALEYGINYNENYKEATGIEYPVPTLEGYTFSGWYWELYNYVLDEGTWNGGYFAVQMDVDLVALYVEAVVA